MHPIEFIEQALKELDRQVESILMNMKLSLTDKDDLMLPISQQKRILLQTKEDLRYLIDNPPSKGGPCKPGQIRQEQEK